MTNCFFFFLEPASSSIGIFLYLGPGREVSREKNNKKCDPPRATSVGSVIFAVRIKIEKMKIKI